MAANGQIGRGNGHIVFQDTEWTAAWELAISSEAAHNVGNERTLDGQSSIL